MITVRKKMSLSVSGKGRKKLNACGDKTTAKPTGTIPRISRLMALAIKYQGMLDRGEIDSITELARLCHVTQPRMSQILSLNLLSPKIQERLLYLPLVESGKPEVHEKMLRPISSEPDWRLQSSGYNLAEAFARRLNQSADSEQAFKCAQHRQDG